MSYGSKATRIVINLTLTASIAGPAVMSLYFMACNYGVKTMTTKETTQAVMPPAGFETIINVMDVPRLDLEVGQAITGLVMSKHSCKSIDPRNPDDYTVIIIDTPDGMRRVTESASLQELVTSAEVGNTVWIQFLGEVKINNKPTPMKQYKTAIKR